MVSNGCCVQKNLYSAHSTEPSAQGKLWRGELAIGKNFMNPQVYRLPPHTNSLLFGMRKSSLSISGAHLIRQWRLRRAHLVIAFIVLISILSVVMLFTFYREVRVGGPVEKEYIEVIDYLNRSVKVARDIRRIVAIGPGALRLVSYLNATDLLVGIEQVEVTWSPVGRDYAMVYHRMFKNLTIVGKGGPGSPPNPEMLKAVKPELIIMARLYAELYSPDKLSEEVGVPVLVIDYGLAGYLDISSFKRAIELLGRVLNREERALQLSRYIDRVVKDLHDRTAGVEVRPKVYVGAVSFRGPQPFTSTQVNFAPLQLINTLSIVDKLPAKTGFISVDFEYILKEQPDYIFIDENNLKIVLDDYAKDRSKYCTLNAFKSGNVYGVLPFNYYHTNVATALADAYFIGKILYPDRFADIDVVAKADEIFRAFLGRPLYSEFTAGGFPGFTRLHEAFKCD